MAETYDDNGFSSELRVRTKAAHDESDRLINLKLAAVVTNTKLWATAIGEFYFVFREIERCLESSSEDPKIGRLLSAVGDGLRTQAFERDLEFYLGNDWRAVVKPSTVVVEYCNRIAEVAAERPILLIAYD
jgi:heme oxygenase